MTKTRDEVTRGLELCSTDGYCCGKCPYNDTIPDCRPSLERDALEMIKMQTGIIGIYEEAVANDDPHDTVNHPGHYNQGKVECIDAIEAATTGLEGIEAVCTGNAIKYLWRWKQKNGVEDLRKAEWYINRLLAEREG